jgi:DNA-binding transcriptional LysR family regulator
MHWADRIGRRLKLRDLHILLAVVQCGSMAKAARQLSVSNPVVSKSVADLEHALDARLLDRGAQGVEPTIYGRALLDHALCVFDELRQAVKHVEFLANPTAGEARIGSSIALASGFIAAVVDRLSRQHPRIIFHLLAAESSITYRALEERKVDLAIARMFKPVADEQMDAEVLYDEQEVVVAGADNSWTRRRKIDLAELMHEPWTLPPPDTLSGSVIAEAFREKGLDLPPSTIITATVPVRSALLATGRFLTIIPSSVLKFSVNNPVLKRLPVELPTTERPVGIITLKNRTISPVAQLFIDCAREIAKTLAVSAKNFRAR